MHFLSHTDQTGVQTKPTYDSFVDAQFNRLLVMKILITSLFALACAATVRGAEDGASRNAADYAEHPRNTEFAKWITGHRFTDVEGIVVNDNPNRVPDRFWKMKPADLMTVLARLGIDPALRRMSDRVNHGVCYVYRLTPRYDLFVFGSAIGTNDGEWIKVSHVILIPVVSNQELGRMLSKIFDKPPDSSPRAAVPIKDRTPAHDNVTSPTSSTPPTNIQPLRPTTKD